MPCPTSKLKTLPAEEEIDPRLVHAQRGHCTAADLPIQLTAEEDRYYRCQNREFEERQKCRLQQQTYKPSMQTRANTSYDMSGIYHDSGTSVYGHSYQYQPQMLHTVSPMPPQYAQQQTQPDTQRLPQQQYPHVQTAYSVVLSDDAFSQSYLRQPPPAHFQQAPARKAELPHPMKTPAQQQHPLHRINQYQLTHSRNLQYTSPPTLSLPTISKPVPSSCYSSSTQAVAPPVPTAEFAHLIGSDWSPAAARCAKDIVANISAEERDELARGIMQRQAALRMEGGGWKAKGVGRKLTSAGMRGLGSGNALDGEEG